MPRLFAMVLAAVALNAVSACGGPSRWESAPSPPASTWQPSSTPAQRLTGGGLAGGSISVESWRQTVATAEKATYEVYNSGCDYDATGSAVAVTSSVLLTNRHVVEGARSLEAALGSGPRLSVISWEVSGVDDIALLHLDPSHPLPATVDTASSAAVPGDLVAALGYPLGGPLKSGLGRVVEVDHDDEEMIRASMDVLPGNSGGPLINTDGQLVGLVRAIDLLQGWAIAVPVDRVTRALDGYDLDPGQPCRS